MVPSIVAIAMRHSRADLVDTTPNIEVFFLMLAIGFHSDGRRYQQPNNDFESIMSSTLLALFGAILHFFMYDITSLTQCSLSFAWSIRRHLLLST